MAQRGRQPLRAERRAAARDPADRSRATGPERREMVEAGRGLFVGRPGRRRRGARQAAHPIDRKGRTVPYRTPGGDAAARSPRPSSCCSTPASPSVSRLPRRSASAWPSRRRACRAPSTSACGSTTSSWSIDGLLRLVTGSRLLAGRRRAGAQGALAHAPSAGHARRRRRQRRLGRAAGHAAALEPGEEGRRHDGPAHRAPGG